MSEMIDRSEILEISSTTAPISAGDLPLGNFWEADGACWQYEFDDHSKRGYRMKPMNVAAFAKLDGPDSPMMDFYLPAMIRVGRQK